MTPPLGDLYDVHGRRLMLHRAGSGSPSVVFLPGAGLIGLEYLDVQRRAAALTTSVLYDRAGTGWSAAADLPRSAADVAAELHDLLRAAAVPGPFVLAGHSLGAFYARRFAQLFPSEVAGLLLIDPGHEDMFDHLPPRLAALNEELKPTFTDLPDLTAEQLTASRTALGQLYTQWPAPVRDQLVEHRLTTWRTGLLESQNMEDELYAELRAGGPLPDVPLIVLTATGQNPFWAKYLPDDLLTQAHDGIRALHKAISDSAPRGEQRLVEGASHQYLHIERPDPVIDAVRDLLTACR